MEYWSKEHKLNDLKGPNRQLRIRQFLGRLSLSADNQDYEYFVAFRTGESSSAVSSPRVLYFSSFREARMWWTDLSRNSFQMANGDCLFDRISGTKPELLSALENLE
jgi:hypothetical protein